MTYAIIPAAGRGRRLGRLGARVPKVALPVGNAPLYHHHLALLSRLGVEVAIFVVSPGSDRLQQGVLEAVTRLERPISCHFVVQKEPRGIAHALRQCAGMVPAWFIVLLGDTWLRVEGADAAFSQARQAGVSALLSVRRCEDPRVVQKECSVRLGLGWEVLDIVEKPTALLGPYKPCGLYLFHERLFDAIDATPISSLRGELELTDAIGHLVRTRGDVRASPIVSDDVNITTEEDLVEANLRWLSHELGEEAEESDDAREDAGGRSRVEAGVTVGAGTRIERSVVGPDAVLGDGTVVRRSVIGPGAMVGRETWLEEVLVLPGARIPAGLRARRRVLGEGGREVGTP